MCVNAFDAHVRPHLREVWLGSRLKFVESELESWLIKQAGGRFVEGVPAESGRFVIASPVRKASDPRALEIETRLLRRALASTQKK